MVARQVAAAAQTVVMVYGGRVAVGAGCSRQHRPFDVAVDCGDEKRCYRTAADCHKVTLPRAQPTQINLTTGVGPKNESSRSEIG
jgi:hypothetical protein